jgi:hypothetical protein
MGASKANITPLFAAFFVPTLVILFKVKNFVKSICYEHYRRTAPI